MLSSLVFSQERFHQQKDSLLKVIPKLDGKEKLDSYYQLMLLVYHNEDSMDSVRLCFDSFIHEAQRQKDIKTEGMVYVNLLASYCNREQMKEAIQNAPPILDFLSINELWDFYYQAYAIFLEACFFDKQYKKTIDNANELYQTAKKQKNENGISAALYSLALVYNKTGRTSEAEKYFRKCITIQQKLKEPTPLLTQSYFYLFEIISENKRSDEALLLINDWKKAIRNYEKNKQLENFIAWGQIYAAYAKIYLDKDRLSEAEVYCDSAAMVCPEPSTLANVTFLRALILSSKKEYPQALKLLDEAYQTFVNYNEQEVMIEIMKAKMQIILRRNGNEEGLLLFETILAQKDSLTNSEFHAQLDELRTIYEVDKLTADKEINRQRWAIAATASGLLLVVLIVYILYSRRLRRKNESLFRQIQELKRIEKTAEEQLCRTPEEQLSREMQLYKRLNNQMHAEKLFTDPELNRKRLADTIGTNEMYLADAIKEATGDTFSSYLSNIRLQYATELLSDKPEMTLDTIAFESGHGSYSSFFRSFTKKYGITPSEYKTLSLTPPPQ